MNVKREKFEVKTETARAERQKKERVTAAREDRTLCLHDVHQWLNACICQRQSIADCEQRDDYN